MANGNSIIAENEETEKQGYYKTITVTDYTDLEGKTDKTKDIVKKVNVKITYMFKAKEQTVELSTILTKENSEKGITLISLTIYILVLTIVVAVIGIITGAFVKSVKTSNFYTDPLTEYTAFNSNFTDEINHQGIKILECKEDYVAFDNGVQYTYISANKGIYKNQVKIAKNVDYCTFIEQIKNGKQVIQVKFKAGSQNRTTTYTLK